MNHLIKRVLGIAGYTLLCLLGLLVLGMGWLYWYSNGTTAPIVDRQGKPVPNSIASLEPVSLNGMKQWILIRGYDRRKPILLFVHGGPGSPEMPMLTNNPELEKRFVVVHWDQRGAGKSYDAAVFNSTFTLDTFVEDAASLSRLLANRFHQPKIYLMGHSWGSFLGVRTVQKYPHLFYAYFGIGQVANQLLGEQRSYDWTMQQARQHQNQQQVTLLTKLGRPPFTSPQHWLDYVRRQRAMVAEYGGAIHAGGFNFYSLVLGRLLLCREYTLRDKLNYLIGAEQSARLLWPTIVATDLNRTSPTLNVPVYIFQGIYDQQTPYSVARTYYDHLEAPRKAFFTFRQSAHGPLFEEPALFCQYLDVVCRSNPALARR